MAVTPPSSFVWGQNGAQLTPEEIARQRLLADQVLMQAGDTSPVGSWTQGAARVVNAIGGVLKERRLNQAEATNTQTNKDLISGLLGTSGVSPQSVAAPGSSASAASPASPTTAGVIPPGAPNDIKNAFMGTIQQGGVTNPSALAAIAATGTAESGFDPAKVNASWADPSQSGQQGTSGGIMSWRNERLANLRNYAQAQGEDPGNISPQTQAKFFLQEDPNLVAKLNSAQSPGEAANLMANAWKFAGYNQPGTGEYARRAALANGFAPQFAGQQAAEASQTPGQVASLDPSAGMNAIPPQNIPGADVPAAGTQIPIPQQRPDQQQAIVNPATMTPDQLQAVLGPIQSQQQPAQAGYVDPTVTTAYQRPQQSVAGIPNQNAQAAATPQQQVAQALTQRNVAPTPQVAAAPPQDAPQAPQQNIGGIVGMTPAIVAALTSPAASPATKQIAGALLQQAQARQQQQAQFQLDQQKAVYEQQLKQQDPAYQANLAQTRAQTENLTNPRMSPSEAANLQLNQQKFGFEQQQGGLTNDIKEYNFAKQNGYQGGFSDYQMALKAAGRPTTTINTGDNSSAFAKKADEEAATRMGGYVTDASNAPALIGDMQQLAALGAQFQTGKGAQAMLTAGPYLQAMGIDVKGLAPAQAYQAITSRLAPQMRATGSGSSSDTDVRMFLQGLPNIANQPGGNDIINATFSALQQHKIAAAELASKAFLPKEAGGITWQEAESQIRKLPNPYEGFNTFRKQLESGGTGQQPAADPNVVPSSIPGVTIRKVN